MHLPLLHPPQLDRLLVGREEEVRLGGTWEPGDLSNPLINFLALQIIKFWFVRLEFGQEFEFTGGLLQRDGRWGRHQQVHSGSSQTSPPCRPCPRRQGSHRRGQTGQQISCHLLFVIKNIAITRERSTFAHLRGLILVPEALGKLPRGH